MKLLLWNVEWAPSARIREYVRDTRAWDFNQRNPATSWNAGDIQHLNAAFGAD